MTNETFPGAIKSSPWMSNENKTLVVLTPGFPDSETDSTCLPMQQYFVRTIKRINPSLHVIVLSFQYPYKEKKYSWFDTPVISYAGKNKGGIPRLLLRQKIYAALKEINTVSPISGLLSFWCGECALTGKMFGNKHGIPHYCWLFGQDAKKDNKYPARMDAHPAELIAISDSLQAEFQKNHGILPAHVIPLGIDTTQLYFPLMQKDIDILGAGSLIPLKHFDIFIEVIQAVRKRRPELKVIIAGEGPEKKKLQKLMRAAGVQDQIILAGELPHSVLMQQMARTRIFLHPSSYEGFSGVCLEALHTGAKVISFCKPMKHEIDHWHIVKSKEEMAEKALTILEDTSIVYNGVTPFTMEDTARRVLQLFY
jgi:glycosyltransferase involved in cell wall biosynthesis